MFIKKEYSSSLNTNIEELVSELHDFSALENEQISIFANCANHLKQFFANKVNWVGFYIVKEDSLFLGPFNGLPAVTSIEKNKGVCGTCLAKRKTIIIDDVCNYHNHIVCDINSRSEICIPIFDKNNEMIALLDIDSPILNMFSQYENLLQTYISHMQKYL